MKKASTALLFYFAILILPLPTPAQTIKAGYTSRTLLYLPLFVGEKKGFFAAEGLQVQLIHAGRSDVQLQALVSGELHFASFNPDGVILFNEKGGSLRIIAGLDNAAPYILVGGRAYKKIEDLRGAKLGVPSLTGGGTSILLDYLRSKGLQHPRDFTLTVAPGGTPGRLSALESGAIAATVLGIPYADITLDQGFTKLGETMEAIPAFQFNSVNVHYPWAEKNRPAVVRFLKAHIRSLRWIFDNLDQAGELFSKELGVKQPYAKRGVVYFARNGVFPVDGSVTIEGLKVNLRLLAKEGHLKGPLPPPEKYLDLSFLRQAQKELGR